MLNKQKGNMYSWITKTRNYIGGECKHKCDYCYVDNLKNKFPHIKHKYSGSIRLIENELNKKEGKGNIIFVQNMSDLFAENIPKKIILKILSHCREYPHNEYIFQTKNPKRFIDFIEDFPKKIILGITIETNRKGFHYNAPTIKERIREFSREELNRFCKFITIEPILNFDLDELVSLIRKCKPSWVNIGADSKQHGLNEPNSNKIMQLINCLKQFTDVKIKDNLKRIIGKED